MIPHELKYDNILRELHEDTFFLGKFILGCHHVLEKCIEGWTLAKRLYPELIYFYLHI